MRCSKDRLKHFEIYDNVYVEQKEMKDIYVRQIDFKSKLNPAYEI